jgi:hypothetical protein
MGRARLGVVGARPGAELLCCVDHSLELDASSENICRCSTMTLDETGEHGGNPTGEVDDFVGFGLRNESKRGEKLEA